MNRGEKLHAKSDGTHAAQSHESGKVPKHTSDTHNKTKRLLGYCLRDTCLHLHFASAPLRLCASAPLR